MGIFFRSIESNDLEFKEHSDYKFGNALVVKLASQLTTALKASKEKSRFYGGFFLWSIESNKLAPTYVATLDGAVFSVVEGLTSVFGMRTGVPLPLTHQLITFNQLTLIDLHIQYYLYPTNRWRLP